MCGIVCVCVYVKVFMCLYGSGFLCGVIVCNFYGRVLCVCKNGVFVECVFLCVRVRV